MHLTVLRAVFVERILLALIAEARGHFGAEAEAAYGRQRVREKCVLARRNDTAAARKRGLRNSGVSNLVLEATCHILIGRQDRCLMKNVDGNVTLGDVESAGVSPATSFESRFRSSTVHLPRSFVSTSCRLCLMPVRSLGRRNYDEESQIWIA